MDKDPIIISIRISPILSLIITSNLLQLQLHMSLSHSFAMG